MSQWLLYYYRTTRYLAPEALQGRFTKACDVFSLGITMLELACNLDLPRHGDLWQKIRMEGPDPSPGPAPCCSYRGYAKIARRLPPAFSWLRPALHSTPGTHAAKIEQDD